jgi:hypothetical protein
MLAVAAAGGERGRSRPHRFGALLFSLPVAPDRAGSAPAAPEELAADRECSRASDCSATDSFALAAERRRIAKKDLRSASRRDFRPDACRRSNIAFAAIFALIGIIRSREVWQIHTSSRHN